jgi:hypothetical protein
MKKHLKIDIQMDKHNAEEEMEITEHVPLSHNAYKIFKNATNNHWKENSERNTICHRKKPPVTRRTYLQGKKLPVKGRDIPSL